MRSTYMFRDQVQKVSNWFKSWNECEQTVALFSLLRKLSPTQSKFLFQVLDQKLVDNTELQTLETQANNAVYICSLCQESKEYAVSQLLICLPLLHPGNTEAKMEYLKVLPLILNHSVENGCHIEESRQLLSYSLIHPALTHKERSHLSVWLSHLEEQYAYNVYQKSHGGDGHITPELISLYLDKNGRTDNTNIVHSANNVHKSATGWQQLGSRDSGIVVNSNESISPTSELIGMVSHGGGSGRAITSTAAINPGAKSGLGVLQTGVDVNLNGAGLAVDSHSTLHATLSGPAAFSTVPSSQASNTNLPNNFQILPQHNNGSSSHGNSVHGSSDVHRKLSRSISALTTNSMVQDSNVSEWLNRHHEEMVQGVIHTTLGVTQSEPPHAPLSPQSSVSSSGSGSEGHHEDSPQTMRNTFLEESSGMRDVPVWLKSLRLHKYSYLFQTMTYDDMLTLTEEWLKSQNVTKGARNKIILNTRKLQERHMCLQIMEKEIMESGNLKQALTELRSMMNTPIKAYTPTTTTTAPPAKTAAQTHSDYGVNTSNSTEFSSSSDGSGGEGSGTSVESSPDNKGISSVSVENLTQDESVTTTLEEHIGDLPGQITRVLGKICTQLLVSTRPEDDCFSMYLQMLDKCMMHEAFTMEQKRKLLSWRQQIQKIWHPIPQRYGLDRQRKGFGNTFPPNSLLRNQRALRGQIIAKPGQPKWTFGGHPPVTLAPIGTGTGAGMPLYHNNAFTNTAFTPIRPAMVELKTPLARTHSAPIKSNTFGFALGTRPIPDMSVTEPEINARLDSLCLSMTEHALGSFTDVS